MIPTSVDVQLIPDLPADLPRRDVLLPVQRVHHIELLVQDQFCNNLNAVPLRQPEENVNVTKMPPPLFIRYIKQKTEVKIENNKMIHSWL